MKTTRNPHNKMDGTIVGIDEYFVFETCKMLCAHDEVHGDVKNLVNCKCSTKYTENNTKKLYNGDEYMVVVDELLAYFRIKHKKSNLYVMKDGTIPDPNKYSKKEILRMTHYKWGE